MEYALWSDTAIALTPDEEVGLIEWAQRGDRDAMTRLFDAHSRFIYRVAKQFSVKWRMEIEDCFQSGAMGFIEGVYKFDVAIGSRLLTYAYWWIRRECRVAACTATCVRFGFGTPKTAEGRILKSKARRIQMIDAEGSAGFFVDQDRGMTEIDDSEDSGLLLRVLKEQCNERSIKILMQRMNGMTREKIAKRRKLTRERIRQIEEQTINKLTRFLRMSLNKPLPIRFEWPQPPPPFIDTEHVPLREIVTPKF